MNQELRVGLYPGTFDPITNGHVDVILRGTRLVDRLVVGVAKNAGKGPMFSPEERVAQVRAEVDAVAAPDVAGRVEVQSFDMLLMDFAVKVGAKILIRGLRSGADFEYEFQMAGMNARLNPTVETVFLMASERHQFIASRLVKEIGQLGGEIEHFVSPRIAAKLRERFAQDAAPKL